MIHLSAGHNCIGIRVLGAAVEDRMHRVTLLMQRKAMGRSSTLDGCQSEKTEVGQDRQIRQDRAEDVQLSSPVQMADET